MKNIKKLEMMYGKKIKIYIQGYDDLYYQILRKLLKRTCSP